MSNHLHGSLVYELEKYYQIVQTPQPGILRIRAAITGGGLLGGAGYHFIVRTAVVGYVRS
jgi:hypothetical protein